MTTKNVKNTIAKQNRKNGRKNAAAVQPQSITETAVETAETVTAENTAAEPQNTAETAENTAAENAAAEPAETAEKPQKKPAANESQLETVIRIAAENGIDFYVNDKKPHLYLFKFKSGADEKRNTMIFKIRYSNNKQMNMLIKAAYSTDAAVIDDYFTAGKDNECRHYRYIEKDDEKTLRVIIGNFRREKKKAAAESTAAETETAVTA